MIEANVVEAKTKLSQLVEAAERGEQVFLKRNGVLVAQIVPIPQDKFPFGFLKDQAGSISDSILFKSSEEELDANLPVVMPGHALLLDTHVIIWMATDPERLPASLFGPLKRSKPDLLVTSVLGRFKSNTRNMARVLTSHWISLSRQ